MHGGGRGDTAAQKQRTSTACSVCVLRRNNWQMPPYQPRFLVVEVVETTPFKHESRLWHGFVTKQRVSVATALGTPHSKVVTFYTEARLLPNGARIQTQRMAQARMHANTWEAFRAGQKFFAPRSVKRATVTTIRQKVDNPQRCRRYTSTSDPGAGRAHSPPCPAVPGSFCAGATRS